MEAGVVDQVGDDPGQPPAVAPDHHLLGAFGHGDGRLGQAADRDRLADELGHEQVLAVQPDRAGIEATDLEQVLDEPLEPGTSPTEQVERGLRPLGHLVATRLHHLDATPPASSTASAARD